MNTKHKTPILLISKDQGIVETVEVFLQESGLKHDFHHSSTFFEGMELMSHLSIELVLLDLNLPDSHGFKTLLRYLEKVPSVPVVVISSTQNDIIANQSVKAGAQDYLVKGQFDSTLFGRVVRFSLQRAKVQFKLEETARELEYNRKRFLEAQQMAHFGTWEMDLVSNEMIWSDEVYRIFSLQRGSIMPTLSEYLHYVPKDEKHMVEEFFELAGKSGQLHQIEHRILLDGLNPRYVAIQAKLQVEDLGEKILLVGSVQDITERKTSERLFMEKNISNQNARIQEEVLSDLGFQIRTPLSSIVNLLFLLENTETSEQQATYVSDLKTSVNDLSISTNNLLNFSFLVSDNLKLEEEDFNLREFFKGTENVVKMKADAAGLNLVFNLDAGLPDKISGDPKKLTQMLFNVIEYAIKESSRTDKITIEVAAKEVQGMNFQLCTSVYASGKKLSLTELMELRSVEKLLQENPEDHQRKPGKQKLGIAIATKLATLLGGKLDIRSTEPSGMAFHMSMPAKIARQTKLVPGNAPDVPIHILLVEDHFLNQIATKKVLTSWSSFVSVDIAENGQVGVEKFKEFNHDLVLMDIQMPVLNGIEASRQIRAFSTVPIIALTANSTKQEEEKCYEIGMSDYLAKPFKPEELYAKIMAIMSLVEN